MKLRELVLAMLYPSRCPICDNILPVGRKGCCNNCQKKLPYIGEHICMKCGKPLRDEVTEYCEDCKEKDAAFERGLSLFYYDSAVRKSIMRFKYHGRREYGSFYGEELYRRYGEEMRKWKVDLLVPVPLHKKRQLERGYNQAAEIARALSELSRIPMDDKLLLRVKETRPQKELKKEEREQNLQGAFTVDRERLELYKKANCVIIIDDIYTTGSTINACANSLRQVGINNIFFFCVAIGKSG